MSDIQEETFSKVDSDWGPDSPVRYFLKSLLGGVNPHAMSMITPRMASQLAPILDVKHSLAYMHYLASERIGLLTLKFATFDDAGELTEISYDTMRGYLERHEPIIHPGTGHPIEDPNKEIFIYFVGTDVFRRLRENL